MSKPIEAVMEDLLGSSGLTQNEITEVISENPQIITQIVENPEIGIPLLFGVALVTTRSRGRDYTPPDQVHVYERDGQIRYAISDRDRATLIMRGYTDVGRSINTNVGKSGIPEGGSLPKGGGFSTGMGIDESDVPLPETARLDESERAPRASSSRTSDPTLGLDTVSQLHQDLTDVNNLWDQGRQVGLDDLFGSFQNYIDDKNLSKTQFIDYLRTNYGTIRNDALASEISNQLSTALRFRPPAPTTRTTTAQRPKRKDKTKTEDPPPIPPPPRPPRKPRPPTDSDDEDEDGTSRGVKIMPKGRMRPRFPRENNTYKDSLYEGEESEDDLWGDDIDEAEVVIQETSAWRNKFWDHEVDSNNPLVLAGLMDDAMRFYGEPNVYSYNMSKNTSYSPDWGFVYH